MGVIGQGIGRLDGRLTVTGQPTCPAEHKLPRLAYGVMVRSMVPKGRITAIDGGLVAKSDAKRGDSMAAVVTRNGSQPIADEASAEQGDEKKRYAMQAFGAVFVEVHVDPELGTVRMPSIVGEDKHINELGTKGVGGNRYHGRGGGDRECDLSRDGKAEPGFADHAGQVDRCLSRNRWPSRLSMLRRGTQAFDELGDTGLSGVLISGGARTAARACPAFQQAGG